MQEKLFEAPECHVFRLPASDILKSEKWEGNHIWTGAIEVVRRNGNCELRLFESASNTTFGVCPLADEEEKGPQSVQQASDSTRCFVVRVEQGTQFAYLGINFQDRSHAFNFNSAILNRNKHQKLTEALPEKDRALQQGEKVHVDLFGKVRTQNQTTAQLEPNAPPPVSLLAGPSGSTTNRRISARREEPEPQRPTVEESTQPRPSAAPSAAPAASAGALDSLLGDPEPQPKPKQSAPKLTDIFDDLM